MTYSVRLPQFEGPLDLLLTLVQQGQVDLREIPLATIAEEYLAESRDAFGIEPPTIEEAMSFLADNFRPAAKGRETLGQKIV